MIYLYINDYLINSTAKCYASPNVSSNQGFFGDRDDLIRNGITS